MAFALATGRYIGRLSASQVVETHGFGQVQRSSSHPNWLLIADQNSPIEQSPDPRNPWRVACDGYLSNFAEMAASLPDAQHLQTTRSISQLVAAWLDHAGPDALFKLVGNFALVAANENDGSVVAMRDRMGGRTLYRLEDNSNGLLIASRSAWVQMISHRPFRADEKFLASFFALQPAPPPGRSAFAGVSEFLPGEQLESQSDRIRTQRPDLDLAPDFDYSHPGDCIVRFRELFEQAVNSTLPATGNVACMLSGGLDSAPAAILADRVLADRNARVIATSWTLKQFPEACEAKWIAMAAQDLQAEPLWFDASHMLPFRHLDDRTLNPDTPHHNAFREPVLECYRLAAEAGCRVILNGNAGDEIYAPPHLLNIDRLKRRQWRPIWRDLKALFRHQGLSGLVNYPAFRHPLARLIRPFSRTGASAPVWLTPDNRKHWQAYHPWPPEIEQTAFPNYTDQLLGARMAYGRAHENAFPNRYGVDRRDPFHDDPLARFMLHAPFSLSHRQGHTKWVMRQATKGLLPKSLRAKSRTGLLNPFWDAGQTTNQETIKRLLFEHQMAWQAWVEPKALAGILHETRANTPAPVLSQCIGYALWNQYWTNR